MLFNQEIIFQPASNTEFAPRTVHRHVARYATSCTCMPSGSIQPKQQVRIRSNLNDLWFQHTDHICSVNRAYCGVMSVQWWYFEGSTKVVLFRNKNA